MVPTDHYYLSNIANVVEIGILIIFKGLLSFKLTCLLSKAGSYSTAGRVTTQYKINQ
jgi:hypothetical protein